MLETEAQMEGIGPNKTVILLLKHERGSWYRSQIPIAKSIEDRIDDALSWLGRTIRVRIEKGEIEEIQLVEP